MDQRQRRKTAATIAARAVIEKLGSNGIYCYDEAGFADILSEELPRALTAMPATHEEWRLVANRVAERLAERSADTLRRRATRES
jgi:hypothetical protein